MARRRRADGSVVGSRRKGQQHELEFRWRGQTCREYFPLAEAEAMANYKDEVDRLEAAYKRAVAAAAKGEPVDPADLDEDGNAPGPDDPPPDAAEFYMYTAVGEPNPLSRRSSLREAVVWYVESQRLRGAKKGKFDALLRHLADTASVKLARLGYEDIHSWVVRKLDTGELAVTTLEDLFARLKAVTKKLVDDKKIWSDPCAGISVRTIAKELGIDADPPRLRNFKKWSIERMAKVACHFLDPGDQVAFMLMAFMGLRIMEALMFRACDIDLERRVLEVHGTKTIAAHRFLPIPLFVWDYLCAAIELIHGCPIEQLTEAQAAMRLCPISDTTWRCHFYEVQDRLEIPAEERYWPHALRHWFDELVDDLPSTSDRFERWLSIYMGHEVGGYLRSRGAALMTFGTYNRTTRRGLTELTSLLDELVVNSVGLIFPTDPLPAGPVSPALGQLTIEQVAARMDETKSHVWHLVKTNAFRTARKVPGSGVWATREVWVIDEAEVESLVEAARVERELSATPQELEDEYQVSWQTIMAVVADQHVPHRLGRRRRRECYLIDRADFALAAWKVGLDQVATCFVNSRAARELDCSRKEVVWLVQQGRLETIKLAFDTRGTNYITGESLLKEKVRRTRGVRLGDELGYTSAEITSLLSCEQEDVWAMRRAGLLPVVLDVDDNIVTPASAVEKVLSGTSDVVTIADAARIIGCSHSTVLRHVGKELHVVFAKPRAGGVDRMLLRTEVEAFRDAYRARRPAA